MWKSHADGWRRARSTRSTSRCSPDRRRSERPRSGSEWIARPWCTCVGPRSRGHWRHWPSTGRLGAGPAEAVAGGPRWRRLERRWSAAGHRHRAGGGAAPAPASGSFRPSDSIGVFPLVVQGFPPLMVYYLDMSSIVGKRQGNHTYYYLVESARVDGKPRIVSQQYLGSAAEVMAKLSGTSAGEPVRSQHKSFGDLAAVWSMLERLDVAGVIDGVVARRGDALASVGTYLALATAN